MLGKNGKCLYFVDILIYAIIQKEMDTEELQCEKT